MRSCLVLIAICWMMMQVPYPDPVQAQSFSEPALEKKTIDGSDTQIIPSLRVTERYDSNVFFVGGGSLDDYVTTISPQLKLTHKNQWVETLVSGGANTEVYVKNPELNYVGGNGSLDLNLDGAMNRIIQGLGLRVTDFFVYTPQPLAFTDPTGGSQIREAFVEGIQVQRVNSFTNTAKIDASYFFSPSMGVTSTYVDQRRRFQQPIAPPTETSQRGLIDTNFQTFTSGFVGKPSPSDTVLLVHQYQKATFPGAERGESGFSTQGALARWTRSITPTFQAKVEGGFTVISSSSNVYPVGTVSLRWMKQYTTAEVSYSQAVAPSFFVASLPLLNQVVTGMVKRQLTEPLSVSLIGSYAINKSLPDSSLLHFESYSVMPSLEYKFGRRITAILSYTHSQFQQTFSAQPFDFDRNLVMFSLLSEWK